MVVLGAEVGGFAAEKCRVFVLTSKVVGWFHPGEQPIEFGVIYKGGITPLACCCFLTIFCTTFPAAITPTKNPNKLAVASRFANALSLSEISMPIVPSPNAPITPTINIVIFPTTRKTISPIITPVVILKILFILLFILSLDKVFF